MTLCGFLFLLIMATNLLADVFGYETFNKSSVEQRLR